MKTKSFSFESPWHAAWLEQEVAERPGAGADVAIEATGSPKAIPTAFKCVRQFGRAVLLGSPRGMVEVDAYRDIHSRSVRVIGSNNTPPMPQVANPYWPWTPHKNEETAIAFLAKGRLQLGKLISHRLEAEDNLDIFDRLARNPGDYLGVVLEWTG